jgi:hypothetical protein
MHPAAGGRRMMVETLLAVLIVVQGKRIRRRRGTYAVRIVTPLRSSASAVSPALHRIAHNDLSNDL